MDDHPTTTTTMDTSPIEDVDDWPELGDHMHGGKQHER